MQVMNLRNILLVALGGGLGSVVRFLAVSFTTETLSEGSLPLGVVSVNIVGCLVIGILFGLSQSTDLISEDLKLFLFVGILGGFTTFSAFGLEAMTLLRAGMVLQCGLYVGLSVVGGILAVAAGAWLMGLGRS